MHTFEILSIDRKDVFKCISQKITNPLRNNPENITTEQQKS